MPHASQKPSFRLKSLFNNRASKFFFRHSDKIATVMGFTADAAYLAHESMTYENSAQKVLGLAASTLFVFSSISLSRANKFPVLSFRVSAALTVSAAALQAASAVDYTTGTITNMGMFLAPLIGFVPGSLIMYHQDKIAAFGDRLLNSRWAAPVPPTSNKILRGQKTLVRAFAKVCKYPIASSTAFDFTGSLALARSYVQEGNLFMAGVSFTWAIAELGIGASDPTVQDNFKKYGKQEDWKVITSEGTRTVKANPVPKEKKPKYG